MKRKRTNERRKCKRVTLFQEMYFGNRGVRKADDISEQGMFISAADVYLKGSIIDLKFRLFTKVDPITVQAEVCYSKEGKGMGVRFIDLKPKDRAQIRKFVKKF